MTHSGNMRQRVQARPSWEHESGCPFSVADPIVTFPVAETIVDARE